MRHGESLYERKECRQGESSCIFVLRPMNEDRFDQVTRRQFLKTSALVTAAALTSDPQTLSAQATTTAARSERLISGWEHYRGSLGGPWEVWHGSSAKNPNRWTKVELPHCFNARDAVDPDTAYYRGQGWYRTSLQSTNAFPN